MGALIDTMSQMSSENQMFFFAFSHLLGSTIRTSIYSQLIKKTNYIRSIFFGCKMENFFMNANEKNV